MPRDFAPINTPRFRLRYRSAGQDHALVMRYARTNATPPTALTDALVAFVNAMVGIRFNDWAPIGAEVAQTDSAVFLPVPVPTGILAGTSVAPNAGQRPCFMTFQGRSVGGVRTSVYMFGVGINTISTDATQYDYRLLATENAAVANALSVLNGAASLRAVDDGPVYWHQYANIGYHAYYQRKARK